MLSLRVITAKSKTTRTKHVGDYYKGNSFIRYCTRLSAFWRLIMIVSLPSPDTVMKLAAKITLPVAVLTNGCINTCHTTASLIASDIVFVTG